MLTNKDKGRIGLSMAINYFTIKGYTISLPLNDTQWYDMVIEKNNIFQTVQCKCTFTEDDTINIKSCDGTNGSVYDSILNHPELDYLFCVNKDFNCWLIPVKVIVEAGITKSFRLRTKLAPSANPKLDTTLYQVQILDRA